MNRVSGSSTPRSSNASNAASAGTAVLANGAQVTQVKKEVASSLLLEHGNEGSFILRESTNEPGLVILAVRIGGKVEQFMIKPDPNGPYKLGKFLGSLNDIIEHHKQYALHGTLLTEALPARVIASASAQPKSAAVVAPVETAVLQTYVVNDVARRPVWLHGLMAKEQAEQLLIENGKTGSFLIRISPTSSDHYALALRREEGDVKHLKITVTPDMQYTLGDGHKSFQSLEDLVETYRTSASLWATKLADPVPVQAVLSVAIEALKQGTLLNTVSPKGTLTGKLYCVDEFGQFLMIKASNERKWLPIRQLTEIRKGQNTKTFKLAKQLPADSLAFSILFRDFGPDVQSFDLIASTLEEYDTWITGLNALMQNIRKLEDPYNSSEFLRTEWLDMGLSIEHEGDTLQLKELELMLRRMHILLGPGELQKYIAQAIAWQQQAAPNTIPEDSSRIPFLVFARVFSMIKSRRPDLQEMFSISNGTMGVSEFRRFLMSQIRAQSGQAGFVSGGGLGGFNGGGSGLSTPAGSVGRAGGLAMSLSNMSLANGAAAGGVSVAATSGNSGIFVTEQEAMELLMKYEQSQSLQQQKSISRRGFFRFLLSRENDIFNQNHVSVFQDMSQPLTNYFISTSHNTCMILDNAAAPEVAIDGYVRALLAGVRCLHLEVYDGPAGDGEPYVSARVVLSTNPSGAGAAPASLSAKSGLAIAASLSQQHQQNAAGNRNILQQFHDPLAANEWLSMSGGGGSSGKKTLTVPIPLSSVLKVVLSHGFVTSPYPIILTLINRCSQAFQRRMAQLFVAILGDGVLAAPLSDSETGAVPSPSQLKGRVLLLASKQVTDVDWFDEELEDRKAAGNANLSGASGNSSPVPAPSSGGVMQGSGDDMGNRVDPAFAALVFLELHRFQSINRLRTATTFEVPALNERRASELWHNPAGIADLADLSNKNLIHVRPSNKRPLNTNYDPILAWNSGVQMAALNIHARNLAAKFNAAKFKVNGGCGFVLKPVFLRLSNPKPAGEASGLTLIVRVISAQQLRRLPEKRFERSGSKKSSDPNDKPVSPFVVVETCGPSRDSSKMQTSVVSDNGFDPEWTDNNEFMFSVNVAELTYVRFAAYDSLTKQILGQTIFPLTSLNEGYRHVRLLDEDNEMIDQSTIFVHVAIRQLSLLGGRLELTLDDLLTFDVLPFQNQSLPSPTLFLGNAGGEILAQQYGASGQLMKMLKSMEGMIERQARSRTLIEEMNDKLARADAVFINATDCQQYRFTYHRLPQAGVHEFRLCNVYEYLPASDTYVWKAYFFLY